MFEHIPVVLAQGGELTVDKQPRYYGSDSATNGQTGTIETQGQSGANKQPANKSKSSGGFPPGFILMLLILGVFMFMMMSGSRREKKRQKKMLASITKGSKVVTVGGILGTVVELRDHEVMVKVDENANTRMRFTREAIKSVLKDDED